MPDITAWNRLQRAVPYLLYATALVPAIVINRFLFPYIAPRTALFRLVIEAALIAAAVLVWRYHVTWRWRKNYVLYVFTAFIGVNIISTFFSFSPLIAWFSDYERMWGVFTLMHVWLFYMLVRAFFSGNEWRRFFNVTLGVSVFIALYGIVQYYPQLGVTVYQSGVDRIIATLGNAAYVSIYTTFAMAIAVFMVMKSRTWLWRALYAGAFALNAFAFVLAGTRGTLLGIMAGVTVAGLLYILIGGHWPRKALVAGGIVALAGILFFAISHPQNAVVQSTSFLRRLSDINLAGGTVETRLIGWNAAWQGFKDYPAFGVGLENYNVIFNKYFDSDYYLIAPSEPYFDRSHNAWLDILVLNGAVGFVIFLGFVGVAGYYLYRGRRDGMMAVGETLIFTALLTAYFVHLIFVFDDLNSYLYFIAVLAFLEYRTRRDTLVEWGDGRVAAITARNWAIGGIVVAVIIVAWQLNVKVLLAGNRVIDALRAPDIQTAVDRFDDALAYDVIPSRNVVLSYVNYLTQRANNLQQVMDDPQDAQAFREGLRSAHAALEQEIQKDPENALLYNRFAVLNTISYLATGEQQYAQQSVDASHRAIALSPEHLRYYYTLADLYVLTGQPQQAIEPLQTALAINSQFAESYYQLAKAYVDSGELDKAYEYLELVVQKEYRATGERIFFVLADKFAQENKPQQELATIELAYRHLPENVQVHSRLVIAYLQRERADDAIAVLEHLRQTAPELEREATYLIQEIQAGKTGDVLRQLTK